MVSGTSPTVRRRRLASELRRLREAANLSCEQTGDILGWSGSKVYKMETGRVGAQQRDLIYLLDVYNVDERERERLLDLAKAAKQRGWWHEYRDVISAGHSTYIGLEADASAVHTYECMVVPGLLQTEGYARALFQAAKPDRPAEEFERRVAVRMARQSRLFGPDRIQVWAVLDESVLHRHVGDLHVMREQLEWLLKLVEQPNVTVQVLRLDMGAHAGMRGAFSMLSFPELTDPDVVFVDSPAGEFYLEEADDIERCRLILDHVRSKAIPPEYTPIHLRSARRRLDEED